MRTANGERGAAAVEFALVFPLVIMLLITVLEFSRLWNVQATITDAASIAARYAGVHYDPDDVAGIEAEAEAEARNVPGFVDWAAATVTVVADCEDGKRATATIAVEPGSITAWFASVTGNDIELNATGTMPCSG